MTLDQSIATRPDRPHLLLRVPSATVDRSGCEAKRHGDWTAYSNGCRCADARTDWSRHRKLVEAGLAAPRMLDATGSVRRLRALAAIGWRTEDIAADTGLSVNTLRTVRRWYWKELNRDLADPIKASYARLSTSAGPSNRMRGDARRNGWASPLDWHNIDDPDEQPENPDQEVPDISPVVEADFNHVEALLNCRLRWDDLRETDREHLLDELVGRYTLADIADRCHTTHEVLIRAVDKRRAQRRRQGLAPLPPTLQTSRRQAA